jgi:hypothetical protein
LLLSQMMVWTWTHNGSRRCAADSIEWASVEKTVHMRLRSTWMSSAPWCRAPHRL